MEIKGFTYGYFAQKGLYNSQEGKYSQNALLQTGINWVCLAFPVNQKSYYSTEFYFDYRFNVPDLEIIDTINRFHEKNVKVCLKPMINCSDGVWRALIDFPDGTMFNQDDYYWKKWFEFYQAFLEHYAKIAEHAKCEMFCLGCEMLGAERKENYWREIISKVRKIYGGSLVYNTNHGKEDAAKWYDAIDYLGISAYYPVEKEAGGSLQEMEDEWKKIAEKLKQTSLKIGKKIIFMEIGCRSALGCAKTPWDFTHTEFPFSEDEQANFYESSLKVMTKEDWFTGYFWWDWGSVIYKTKEDAQKDKSFNVHLKKAEDVVKKWYNNF